MSFIFFVSSIGDTDLAKATMAKILEKDSESQIFIIPLTQAALKRTEDLNDKPRISLIQLNQIVSDFAFSKNISKEEIQLISKFISEKNIHHAYIGVPSVDQEIPFQIAQNLKIQSTIAYEFMFKPALHCFWKYVDEFASRENFIFAVPLASAAKDILAINGNAKISEIGHLSIDRCQMSKPIDAKKIRESLFIKQEEEFIFISGTTQSVGTDMQFVEALLSEISSGQHPSLQLRFGLHPGIADINNYLKNLLTVCQKYPSTQNQFKIMLSDDMKLKINFDIKDNVFIQMCNISGPDAAQAADKVTQAVPGALLNESAMKGKPSYFHNPVIKPYLPDSWFENTITSFFIAKPRPAHTRQELGLSAPADELLVNTMLNMKQ